MYYFEVLVASSSFYGRDPLTYSSDQVFGTGQVVLVPLRQKYALGIIKRAVEKPSFSIKPIKIGYKIPALPDAVIELIDWLGSYYPAPLGSIVQLFLPNMLSEKLIEISPEINLERPKIVELPPLTPEQKNILKAINYRSGTYLLHGETGSGKTRIYLELTKQVLKNNQSALILTPEIGLTSQLISFIQKHVDRPVVLLHSQLTEAERRTSWLSILNAKGPLVIIGPRSALFAPIKQLGLVVVDEAHENGYKQEQAPHYSALRVASELALLHKSIMVMGSATPDINDYYFAQSKHVPILRMSELAKQPTDLMGTSPRPQLIDLKDRKLFSRANHLSDPLIQAISDALNHHQQSLLFLNRRGTARVIVCQNCGWQSLCPNCDLPLTYHGDTHSSRCHVCGFIKDTPSSCPICSSSDIIFKSIGTKSIVEEVQRIFPNAAVKRFDNDNKKADSFNNQYEDVKSGKIGILVGTQTLAKGLDLPRLSVVGVIIADTSLYLPDYTANERTYQLLYQVLGRVSRGHVAGQAFIQSYDPDNSTIQAAVAKDWDGFYESQLIERRTFLFPPFCFLLKLTCRRARSAVAEAASVKLADLISKQPLKVQVVGPSPSFHEKVSGKYQWQLVIKSKRRSELLKVIDLLPAGWSYDIDPSDLL